MSMVFVYLCACLHLVCQFMFLMSFDVSPLWPHVPCLCICRVLYAEQLNFLVFRYSFVMNGCWARAKKKKSSSSLRHRHIYTRIIKEKKKHKHLKLYRYRFCLGWNKPHYDQFRREWKHELTRNATRQTLVIMPLQCFFYFCRCTKWLVVCSRLEQRSVFSDNVRLNDGWVVCAVHVPYSAVATDDDWNWIELYWNDIHDVFQFIFDVSLYVVYIFSVHTFHIYDIYFCTHVAWHTNCILSIQ